MKKDIKKQERRNKIRRRVRSTIQGTAEQPRMCVYKSNNHIYVQLVDDITATTLAAASTNQKEVKKQVKDSTKTEAANLVGQQLAKQAKDNGIEKVIFDRSGYKYHGIVKAVAEGARDKGLEF